MDDRDQPSVAGRSDRDVVDPQPDLQAIPPDPVPVLGSRRLVDQDRAEAGFGVPGGGPSVSLASVKGPARCPRLLGNDATGPDR